VTHSEENYINMSSPTETKKNEKKRKEGRGDANLHHKDDAFDEF
jgi:hypothetical protein